jgi:hypothetical protein
LVGNLPDRARLHEFFGERYVPGIERDNESALGVWRTTGEFEALAAGCGWSCEFRRMPPGFYAAHYRYDAILARA